MSIPDLRPGSRWRSGGEMATVARVEVVVWLDSQRRYVSIPVEDFLARYGLVRQRWEDTARRNALMVDLGKAREAERYMLVEAEAARERQQALEAQIAEIDGDGG